MPLAFADPLLMCTTACTERACHLQYNSPAVTAYFIIVGRGVQTPLFYKDPPPILPTPFISNFAQPPLSFPCCLQPPSPLLILLSCFFG